MKDKDRIICDVMMKKGIIKEMHIKDAGSSVEKD